ncbi:MAG: DUF6445 family protein [Sphingorhabdus lacus]|jgi:Family of unknown function (DUF6445)
MRFEPSPSSQLDILKIGQEEAPLVQVDNVLQDPSALVRYAANEAEFSGVDSNLYPGIRAPMPLDYVEGVVRALDPVIRNTYRIDGAKLAKAECFFSIVTTAPSDLQPLQKVPHIDTTDSLHFAVVHYLCAAQLGGTAFYRQDKTGYESVGPERAARWIDVRDAMLAQMPEMSGYMAPSTPGYTQTAHIEARFDRLILYRSNMLHSGVISRDTPLNPDPRFGRLTANLFIAYRRP